jgi:segregation and condensation protein A
VTDEIAVTEAPAVASFDAPPSEKTLVESSLPSGVRVPEGVKLPDGTRWEGHHVTLDRFEGPLDMLLLLVREKQIAICDINISEITDQFLAHLKILQEEWDRTGEMDLDFVGDFLVMAAILIQLKTRELLPVETAEAIDEAEMTRDDLIRLLEEYERFKAAASNLEEKMRERSKIFLRDRPSVEPQHEEILKVDLTRLLEAFRTVLRKAPVEQVQGMAREPVRIEERMDAIRHKLAGTGTVLFLEIFEGAWRRDIIIVTFLALLEMMKANEISVVQTGSLGEIRLAWGENRDAVTIIDEEAES